MEWITIELHRTMIDGVSRIPLIRVIGIDGLIESIVNYDRRKDLTHLNQYIGRATVHSYLDGRIKIKGEFVNAGFNEEGITRIQFYEDEVFNK